MCARMVRGIDCDREDATGGVCGLYSNTSASKNENGMKYTPFVNDLRGSELDGFIEHAQDIRVIFLIVSRLASSAPFHGFNSNGTSQ